MKKKYLSLILACILTTSLFVSGCGRLSDAAIEEDDDDEDEDDDEDDDHHRRDDDKDDDEDDDKDDISTAGYTYVEIIEGDELKEQLKLLVRNKSVWGLPAENEEGVYRVSYAVADMDHNGRLEVIVSKSHDYADNCDAVIYEVNSKKNGFDIADWNVEGLDITKDTTPDMAFTDEFPSWFDEKNKTTHYYLNNNYDNGNNEFGGVFCDVVYLNGVMNVYNYAAAGYESGADEMTYWNEAGRAVDFDEFNDFMREFAHGDEWGKAAFGFYAQSYINSIADMEDADVKHILESSYAVFTGNMDSSDFEAEFGDDTSAGDVVSGDINYEDLMGTWLLSSSETNGEETVYDEKKGNYAILTFDEDCVAHLDEYFDGKLSLSIEEEVDVSGAYPYFEYDDEDALPDSIANEQYIVISLGDDKDYLTVYLMFYDEDGYILGYTTLYFNRDK